MAQIGILKIKKLVDALVSFTKENYEQKQTEGFLNESFLYKCFEQDDNDEGISYLEIAQNLFLRPIDDSRKLEVRLLFDRDRATLPTIHVREPAKMKGVTDSIGYTDETLFVDQRFNEDDEQVLPLNYQYKVRRSFNSQFELMITSANRHEVLVIEEVMMALLMGSQDTISLLLPFTTTQITVKELIFNGDITPNLFIKAITLNVNYEKIYTEIINNQLFNKILFEHNLLLS